MKYLNLSLKSTKNNLLLTLTNKYNQLLLTKTLGQLRIPRSAEKNPINSYILTYNLGLFLKQTKTIKFINLYFKGWSPYIRKAIYGLRDSGIRILKFKNNTPIPFNGCKLKKKRRRK